MSSAGLLAAREIWRSGPILEAVQSARLYADSKDFVDAPLAVPPDEAWRRWHALPQPIHPDALRAFVSRTFLKPGAGLELWMPEAFAA